MTEWPLYYQRNIHVVHREWCVANTYFMSTFRMFQYDINSSSFLQERFWKHRRQCDLDTNYQENWLGTYCMVTMWMHQYKEVKKRPFTNRPLFPNFHPECLLILWETIMVISSTYDPQFGIATHKTKKIRP